MTGSPVASARQPPAANRSMPLVAKRAETSAWCTPRKLTASVSAAATAGQDEELEDSENASSGGSADTEITDVAGKPTRRPPRRGVMTGAPAGGPANTGRKGVARAPA